MIDWRDIKIRKLGGGGFLVAIYLGDAFAPPTEERAFSTSEEIYCWLGTVFEPEKKFVGDSGTVMHKLRHALAWA